jgi:radical SAM protein with 4Fe4S-binding SPASM domain
MGTAAEKRARYTKGSYTAYHKAPAKIAGKSNRLTGEAVMENVVRSNPFNEIYGKLNGYDGYYDFPICIDVEVTNNCNLHCLFCPTGTGVSVRDRGFMSEKTFQAVIEGIKGRETCLRFIRWGEPTLHPRIVDFFKTAKNENHLVHLTTNGQLFNEALITDFINIGVDSIKFSFQGVDEKSYQEMRQDACFGRLMENIKMTNEIRGGRTSPYIHIATTTTYETNEEIEKFKTAVKPYCDLVTVGMTKLEHIEVDKTRINSKQKGVLKELKTKESMAKERFKICPEVFGKLSIDWDGKITACCSDYDRKMVIGDINKESIDETFHNDVIEKYREILRKREFEKIPHCNRCFDFAFLQGKNKVV